MNYDVEDRFQSANDFIKAIDGEIRIERQDTRRKVKVEDDKGKKPEKPTLSRTAQGPGVAAIACME